MDSSEKSTIHKNTALQYAMYKTEGRYYNAAWEIENFINAKIPDDSDFNTIYEKLNDPTVTGFKIYFHFASQTGLLADQRHFNSALAYLKRIGEMDRYFYLVNFIATLQKISQSSPWIFKDISGLDDMFTTFPNGKLREHEIEIKTFETIDLKMQRLIMLYRNAAYDDERGVWVLPVNLRRFSFSVYVYDNRPFSANDATASKYLRTAYKWHNSDVVNGSNPRNLAHVLFDCGQAEFTWNSGKAFFSSVSNNNSDPNTNNLSMIVRQVAISDLMLMIDENLIKQWTEHQDAKKTIDGVSVPSTSMINKNLTNDYNNSTVVTKTSGKSNRFISMMKNYMTQNQLVNQVSNSYDELVAMDDWKTGLRDAAKTAGKKALTELATNAAKSVADLAMKQLTKLYLGNVYGFGFDDIALAARSKNPLAAVRARQNSEHTIVSLDNNVKYKNLGNVND